MKLRIQKGGEGGVGRQQAAELSALDKHPPEKRREVYPKEAEFSQKTPDQKLAPTEDF